MKGVRRFKQLGLAAYISIVLFVGSAWGATAVPVSPEAVTQQSCPTFSWSAADNATAYRIEVYEQATEGMVSEEQMRMAARPVISKEITSPALSWTPSEGECLRRGGQYVWYVAGVVADAGRPWSGGKAFQVEASALSVEQKDSVKEVVRETIKAESPSAQAATTGSAKDAGTVKTATTAITPMTLPPIISAYGDGDTTVLGLNAGASLNISTSRFATFIGASAGFSNTTGYVNSFVGYSAGASNTTGNGNSFVGSYAGASNTTGNGNSFVGYGAGTSNTTGSNNVIIGSRAGYNETTGSNKLYIDNCFSGNTPPTGGWCTQPLIYGEFDNRLVRIDGRLEMVAVATPSDLRYKKEVRALESPLEKVLKLQGVTYEWDREKVQGAGYKDGKQIGLIAQEVEMVLPELVHTDSKGYKTLSYDKLGPVLIEAVKEQEKKMRAQEAHFEAALKEKDGRIERLERALQQIEQKLAGGEPPREKIAMQ